MRQNGASSYLSFETVQHNYGTREQARKRLHAREPGRVVFEELEVEVEAERHQINFGKSSRARLVAVARLVHSSRRKDRALRFPGESLVAAYDCSPEPSHHLAQTKNSNPTRATRRDS